MLIKRFQETVETFGRKTAVKTPTGSMTYRELNRYTNRVSNAIKAVEDSRFETAANRQVALLFEHGADMIISVIGTLKADKTYVPLDITYPEKRLTYMLEHSESFLILTNSENLPLAGRLVDQTGRPPAVLNIETIGDAYPDTDGEREEREDSPAYILYTSGSTGRPKGVVQTHRNVLYYTRNWIQCFSITSSDRMTLFSAFSHDGAGQDMFGALLAGATLYPYYIKTSASTGDLYNLLENEKITIWHSVPSLYRYFAGTLSDKDRFENTRWVLLGGESLRPHDLELHKKYFPNALLANVYGQTESSVSTICTISIKNTFDDVTLGEPLDETQILLVGEDGDIIEDMGVGEIVVASDYIALGYWQDKENSSALFTHDEDMGKLYWTGDLGRLTANGSIKMMGRKDLQVKIRGFRVETGEIESILMQHEAVKETAVVTKTEKNQENYLCAYIVSDSEISPGLWREYLAGELPDYMIPRTFVSLDKMPVTPNGKIDRKELPEPEFGSESRTAQNPYVPAISETEKKLAAIWEEILEKEKISITDNFIEVGGHSLLAISIISKIHQGFNVELELKDVFDKPTVKELARLIEDSKQDIFASIEPTEKKEYYAATSEQTRMFVLDRFEGIGTTYNQTGARKIKGKLDRKRLQEAFQMLLERHEVFRTSFKMLEDRLVQVIHEDIRLYIPYIDAEARGLTGEEAVQTIVPDFIRPFDLGKAPLFRVCLVKLAVDTHLLLMDLHHIISDALSDGILMNEFIELYAGKTLPGLKLNYRDYAEWQYRLMQSDQIKEDEMYWMKKFEGKVPVLELPTNYPRSEVQSFEGEWLRFRLDEELTRRIHQLAKARGATLFTVLLGMYNVLLHKYTGQEDIVIGSIISGRNHPDLENIVGFFAKTLALRNHPAAEKTFEAFLAEVKKNALQGFARSQYPFSRLVEKLDLWKDRSRNPLYDAAFVIQSTNTKPSEEFGKGGELKVTALACEDKTAMFDLYFSVQERENGILCNFQYCSRLFKRETIEVMKERFLILIKNILNNPQAKIRDLEYAIPVEKELYTVEDVAFDF